ncbi:MAG: hypothetical protein JWP36_48 [Paucimonas sp.]|nr:hypothetical protein [Paucimonas sp.]
MVSSSLRRVLSVISTALLVASPALAHHGWSWAEGEQSKLVGTIQEISFAPPHPSLVVKAADAVWQIDLANPGATQRAGFIPGAAKPGDTVTIIGNRALDKNKNLMKAVRLTIEGKNFDLYPERIKGN